MGYDLNLQLATDEQIDFLVAKPQYTVHFIEGRRPTQTRTEVVGNWIWKKKVEISEEIDTLCTWPEASRLTTLLYSREGIYYLLNGTNDEVEAITNFPNIGGRYSGEMLGRAFELGEGYLGRVHAFRSDVVSDLKAALDTIDAETVRIRAQQVANEMEWEDALSEIPADMSSLRSFVDRAVTEKVGMIWFWA